MNKLFRNKSTEENVKNLACLLYHYDTRGETSIGLDILRIANIGNITEDDVFFNSKNKYPLLQKYVKNLMNVDFISIANDSYKPGSYRKKYHVNKEKILEQYGETVFSYRKNLLDSLSDRYSKEKFIESISDRVIISDCDINYKILSPGEIIFFKDGKKTRKIKYNDKFGKQLFQLKSFYYNKEALIEFIKSIQYEDISEEIKNKLQFINSKVDPQFKIEFDIHFSIKWTASKKSFSIKKSARSYSAFCSSKKENGERNKVLVKEGLTRSYDIKSTLPRISYFLENNEWINSSVDLYELIYEKSEINIEWTDQLRDLIKKCFMMIYFVDHPHKSYKAYINSDFDKLFSKEDYYKLYKAVYTILGKSYGAYIFYLESLLEIDIMYYFIKKNYKIVNIYDGFYFTDKLSGTDIESYINIIGTNYLLGEIKCQKNLL